MLSCVSQRTNTFGSRGKRRFWGCFPSKSRLLFPTETCSQTGIYHHLAAAVRPRMKKCSRRHLWTTWWSRFGLDWIRRSTVQFRNPSKHRDHPNRTRTLYPRVSTYVCITTCFTVTTDLKNELKLFINIDLCVVLKCNNKIFHNNLKLRTKLRNYVFPGSVYRKYEPSSVASLLNELGRHLLQKGQEII